MIMRLRYKTHYADKSHSITTLQVVRLDRSKCKIYDCTNSKSKVCTLHSIYAVHSTIPSDTMMPSNYKLLGTNTMACALGASIANRTFAQIVQEFALAREHTYFSVDK